MKVKGFDNRQYTFPAGGKVPLLNDTRPRSSLHLRARELLRKLFPTDRILEEVPLPGTGGLTADFYVPSKKMIVETNGEQHYKYIPHFHGTIMNFMQAKANDAKKEEWCLLNNLKIVALSHEESDDKWEAKLLLS